MNRKHAARLTACVSNTGEQKSRHQISAITQFDLINKLHQEPKKNPGREEEEKGEVVEGKKT